LQEIEKEEGLWAESRQKKAKLFTEAKENAVPAMDDAIDSDAAKKKSNAPPGFY